MATFFDGSHDGLARFAAGEGIATGLHIHDAEAEDWNLPIVRERFAGIYRESRRRQAFRSLIYR